MARVLQETMDLIETGALEATLRDRACLEGALEVLTAHLPERCTTRPLPSLVSSPGVPRES